MDRSQEYWVRHKGTTQGPYTQRGILKELRQGKIGLYHDVFQEGGQARALRQWLEHWKISPADYTPDISSIEERPRAHAAQACLWSGLSFLLPPLLPLALLSARDSMTGQFRPQPTAIAIALTLLGTCFWILLAATW